MNAAEDHLEERRIDMLRRLKASDRLRHIDAAADARTALAEVVNEFAGLTLSDLNLALTDAKWIVPLIDDRGDASLRVRVRTALANAHAYANRLNEAIAVLVEARAVDDASDADAARVELAMVQPLARLGRFAEAIRCAENAVGRFLNTGDDVMAAKARSNLAVLHRMRGDPARALAEFDQALPALAHEETAVAQIQSNRAEALLEMDRFQDAEAAFRSALESFRRTDAHRAQAIVEGNLADLLGQQGRYQGAIEFFETARRRLTDDQAHGDAARLGAELAEVQATLGLFDEAVAALKNAIPVLDEHGLAREAARARLGLGVALARSGRREEAELVLHEAANAFAALELTGGLATANLRIAESLVARAELDAAEVMLDDVAPALQRDAERLEHALLRATILQRRGRLVESARTLDEAIAGAGRLDLAPLRADLMHLRAGVASESGRTDDAVRDLEDAVAEIERVRGSLQADRLRAAWLGDRLAPYNDLAAALLAQRDDRSLDRAFAVTEMGRARSLLDMLQGGVELAEQLITSGRTDPAENHLLRDLIDRRTELNMLFSRMDRRPDADDRERRVHALEREIAMLEGRLAATRRFGELFGKPADAQRVSACLNDDDALIEYFMHDGRLGAFVLRRDGLTAFQDLIDAQSLDDRLERIAFQIDRGLASAHRAGARAKRLIDHCRRELHALHDAIFRPLLPRVDDAARIIFVPHGPLFAAPLHAMYDGREHIVQKFDIAFAPSASLVETLHGSAPRRDGATLLVGVPDERAPEIHREIETLSREMPDARRRLGPEATLAAIISDTAEARRIHIATHGVFPADQPMNARLRFSDGWLTARDVYGLNLNGAAVTLSACDAGRSAILAGDEAFGLVRAFLAAGASSIVTSLWAVHDESACDLMCRMYRTEQCESARFSSALAAGQRMLIEQRPHPAFWAPFFCIGG